MVAAVCFWCLVAVICSCFILLQVTLGIVSGDMTLPCICSAIENLKWRSQLSLSFCVLCSCVWISIVSRNWRKCMFYMQVTLVLACPISWVCVFYHFMAVNNLSCKIVLTIFKIFFRFLTGNEVVQLQIHYQSKVITFLNVYWKSLLYSLRQAAINQSKLKTKKNFTVAFFNSIILCL